MSFGDAVRRVRPADGRPCPCGSGRSFGTCCRPVLDGAAAVTAEDLMRSRFTAFAVHDAAHLARTWHPRTRPDDLDLDPGTSWTGLDVILSRGGAGDETGVVEFRARWSSRGGGGELHERSRFARVRGRWVYVDGVIDPPSA
ncbi:MAG: YchJ family metal-binding protein [Microbacterium arborescens]